jgi:large subunit ribosomal protein L29
LKITEIRAMTKEELVRKIEEAHSEMFNLRVKSATRQLASNREIPKVKKKIAQMKTILNEFELGIRK